MSGDFKPLFVLPNFNRSGAVDFIVDLADAIAATGRGVSILSLDGRTKASRMPGASVRVQYALNADDDARGRSPGPIRRTWRSLAVFVAVLRAVRNADVVFLTWENGRALTMPAVAALLLGKPSVAIVQNNINRSIRGARARLQRLTARWVYNRCNAVACVSHDLVPLLAEFGVDRKKLVGIPNAINLERIRRLADKPAPADLENHDKPYVLGVGRLADQKGFDLLIQAHAMVLARGLDHDLVLIGFGPDKYELRALAGRLGVENSVKILGFQPNPYAAMRHASLYCLSSRYEGRALTLAEAASLAVPTVAANCPTGPREVLADGRFGTLVPPEDPLVLASAIEAHLRNPEPLKAKAWAAAARAERYSIDVCAALYINLVHECLGAPARDVPVGDALLPGESRVAANQELVEVVEEAAPEKEVERVA